MKCDVGLSLRASQSVETYILGSWHIRGFSRTYRAIVSLKQGLRQELGLVSRVCKPLELSATN